jgi:hypothetical protein
MLIPSGEGNWDASQWPNIRKLKKYITGLITAYISLIILSSVLNKK